MFQLYYALFVLALKRGGSTSVFMSFPPTWMITVLTSFRGELSDRGAVLSLTSTRKGAHMSSAVKVESSPFADDQRAPAWQPDIPVTQHTCEG